MKKLGLMVLSLAAVSAAGCLQKETTHTVYLSADGGARWVAEESGVYSDEREPGARIAEEQAFIGPALIGGGRMAEAFHALGSDGLVRTTVIRDERPFHVITEAPFASVERMLARLFKETGVPATVTLTRDGDRTTLRIRFDFTREAEERPSPASVLLEDLDRLRFVVADGEFVAGGGFEIPDRLSARIALETLESVGKAMEARQEITLTLTWRQP